MTRRRLISAIAAGTVLAWAAAGAEAIALLVSALSGWCSEEAGCTAQQEGAEAMALFLSAIVIAVALGLIFAAIRAIARPQFSRQRWYVVAAAGLLVMPVAVVLTGVAFLSAFDHHGQNTAPAIIAALAVQAAWLPAWAYGFTRLTDREITRDARLAAAQ
jgi:hypothetical protein